MRGILSLAYITFIEGIRSRALFGIFIMALLMFAVTVTLTNLFMRDIVKVAADLSLATISFSGLLMVIFIGNSLLSKDIDKRTIYMVISRPLSRTQYIWGKFAGIVMLVIAAVVFLGLISSLPVYFAGLTYENPEAIFKWTIYFSAIALIAMKLALIASVTIFFSSFTSTSFISLMLTIATYIIGASTETVKGFLDSRAGGVDISPLMGFVIKCVYYLFPNLATFDIKLQASHGLLLPEGYFIWALVYWFFYAGILVSAASLIMERREFP
ncbi:MAG: ABC transporter permease [Deltaproteobacteria bacterium]|nr:ABC transporter permease [Deltaproteobacteria bacterium]